jgi:hypothetical protein
MRGLECHGFAADCRIVARLTLIDERLSTMMNAQARFRLFDVTLVSLDDGHEVALPELRIDRDELLAVVASGPRGIRDRRVKTEQVRMQLGLGPYTVLGKLHLPPGRDPVRAVMQRGPMMPLTNATIAFVESGAVRAIDAEALIVNRTRADWIQPTADEAEHFPDVPIIDRLTTRTRAKDFTGAPVA